MRRGRKRGTDEMGGMRRGEQMRWEGSRDAQQNQNEIVSIYTCIMIFINTDVEHNWHMYSGTFQTTKKKISI